MLTLVAILFAQAPQHRLFLQPNLSRQSSEAPFELLTTFNFAATPSLPPCTVAENCVFQCRVKDDNSGGACFDATGAELTGYTEGVSAQFSPSYIAGRYAWTGLDDTANANRVPRINNAATRTLFGGAHTVVFQGYPNTVANANGGWYGMITDGTNQFQARRGSGNLECLESPSGNHSDAPLALDGYEMFACSRYADAGLVAWSQGALGSPVASTMAAPASGSFFLWGGTGGCCTPGGTAAGQLVSITGYSEAKSDAWLQAANRAAWGASMVQSGPLGAVGTVASTSVIGKDDLADSGFVFMFAQGAYITDPNLGIHAQNGFTNVWAADPLAVGTWTDVGTPVIASNIARGPFGLWKNNTPADRITDDSAAAFEGKRSTASIGGLDGGVGTWANASCYLQAGDAGATVTKARVRLNTDGIVDAGALACDVTGLTWTFGRYPSAAGCWAWIDQATTITADVLVGNATTDQGDIVVAQCQLTATLFPESPTVNNTQRGATWPELDGGGVPYGATKGKLEAVFQIPYSTAQYGISDLANKASVGSYVFDAFNLSASHDVLVWASQVSNEPSADGLMYGPGGTNENRFDVHPVNFTARSWYVWSYEWRPEAGGCRGKMRLDACADPATCSASTVIASNTSVPGECPLLAHLIVLGTRGAPAGSSPSTLDVRSLKVYR